MGILALTALLVACAITDGRVSEQPSVAATTSIICDLTRQLAGTEVNLTCLLEPGQEPHTYHPTPGDRAAIGDADLVLYSGYNLVPEIEQLVTASNGLTPKVATFEVAVPLPPQVLSDLHHDDEGLHPLGIEGTLRDGSTDNDRGDRSDGNEGDREDDHYHDYDHNVERVDPHVWHSAANGARIVEAITTKLQQVLPEQAEVVDANAEQLVDELTDLHIAVAKGIRTKDGEHAQ